MDAPLVSVIIPVYNTEQYLVECLDSIINQTYKNIEIIAINDGSTDRSLNILQRYASIYPNIKLISQKNQGNSVARNIGIDVSKGKYIYFIDSDDFILPETLSNLIGIMEYYNVDLVRFAAEPFQDGINYKFNRKMYDFQKYFKKEKVYTKEEFLLKNLRAFSPSPCLYLVRRELLINNNLRFYPGIKHEDELFTLELFLNAKLAMYDSNFYYKRRYRKNSIMTSEGIDKLKYSFDSYVTVVEQMNKLLIKYNTPIEIRLIKNRMLHIYNLLLNSKVNDEYKKNFLLNINGISRGARYYYSLKYEVKKLLNINK